MQPTWPSYEERIERMPSMSYMPWNNQIAHTAAIAALTWLEEDALEIAQLEDDATKSRSWMTTAMKYRAARLLLQNKSE